MTEILRHIKALLCVALAVMMTACGSSYDMPEDPADEDQSTFLIFNVGMAGATRAGDDLAIESMHSLRIVVLNNIGMVESNEYFNFGSSRENYSHIIKLKSRNKKKVYIFANEESVTDIQCEPANVSLSGSLHDYLESATEGTIGFETKIAAVNFTPDFSKPIPLNAMYDVEISEGVRIVEKYFWLVRTASKFTFTFINKRKYADITINKIEVNGIADRQFFMPNFIGDPNTQAPVSPKFTNWIDWLKDVSDKTQVNPDSPTADQSGWLTAYDIPAKANIGKLIYSEPFTIKPTPATAVYGKEIANLYCCESKNLRGSGANVVPMEQHYTVHLECTGSFGNDEEQRSFDITLPNLRALFRNTHSHVIITFTEGEFEVKAVVDVVPYRGCILDPYFGLAR